MGMLDLVLHLNENFVGPSKHFASTGMGSNPTGNQNDLGNFNWAGKPMSITIMQLGTQNASQNTVTLFEDVNFGGRPLTLQPGNYPSLKPAAFNGKISSFAFDVRDQQGNPLPIGTYVGPNVVVLATAGPFLVEAPWLFTVRGTYAFAPNGEYIDMFQSTPSIAAEYGGYWGDRIDEVIVFPGADLMSVPGTHGVALVSDQGNGVLPVTLSIDSNTGMPIQQLVSLPNGSGFGLGSVTIF